MASGRSCGFREESRTRSKKSWYAGLCRPRHIIVAAAGYFFAATYWTCTCSMVPLNLNGTLS